METKQLLTLISRIKTNGSKLDSLIQEAALGCIAQAEQHGNVIPANRLWLAMPAGARRNALGVYLCTYGKMRVNTGKDKDENRFRLNKQGSTNLEEAQAVMWHSMTKEKKLEKEFDLTKRLLAVLKQYKQHINDLELTAEQARAIEALEVLAAKAK